MQTITPHLWFDKEAKQAAELYTSIFKDSRVKNTATLPDTPSGTVDLLSIELLGQEFKLINAGPLFKFTPAVSFLVACDTKDEVDSLWNGLSKEGTALMELAEYPFSERYGWTQDRYGLSWQVMFMGDRAIQQRIIPTLMFVGEQGGKAEYAIHFYTSVFRNAKVDHVLRYGKNEKPDKEGTIKHAGIVLEGQSFAVMDSARAHGFTFNEAISLMVRCNTQEEIDYFWSKLSADPKAGQCGWLKDQFGFSWQIVPAVMEQMLQDKNEKKLERVTQAFLKMKKFDIAKLEEAYEERRSAV
jgi:predicted 3-demethylubiquinone-9 3-methyltransferase (glyoxalase superfamily)